ncbi:MAG: hypothetical protein ABIK27_05580 [Bacteroidota bacterium]
MLRSSKNILTFLIAPDVEPAQPPTNIRMNKMNCATGAHRAKSVVAKPVQLEIEITLKKEYLKDSSKP